MMKENKPYPQWDEEDGSCLSAREPVAGMVNAYSPDVLADNRPYDIPGLPQTWDELLDCIEEGEQEFERGEAIPWEVATKDIKAHIRRHVA